MSKGLGDNPLSRKKVEEFPGTDLNFKGIDRVLYETRQPIEDQINQTETENPQPTEVSVPATQDVSAEKTTASSETNQSDAAIGNTEQTLT